MDRRTIVELYLKERNYQQKVFGNYADIKVLNLASFLEFVERYLEKAKVSYTGKWSSDEPAWFKTCAEKEIQSQAPVKTYEYLIKVFTLAGAALEAYLS